MTEEIQETEEIRETEPPQYAADAETEEAEEPAFEFEEESLDADEDEDLSGEDTPEFEITAGATAGEDEFEETTDSAPAELGEDETDASASHRVDPSSPTGFRLFGFGKRRRKRKLPTKKAAVPVSTYAPGAGLVEEEVIEGEEFDGRAPCAPAQARSARPGRIRRGDTALEHAPRRRGRNVPGGAPRPPHPAKSGRAGRRRRRGRGRRGRRDDAGQRRRFAADNAAIAGSVDAALSAGAAPRAARHRLQICPSSRTC